MKYPDTTLTDADIARGDNFVDLTQVDLAGNPKKLELKGIQAKSTLPEYEDWQKANPAKAVLNRYRHPHTMQESTGFGIGTGLRNWATGDNILRKGFGSGVLPGGVTGGLLGAGAGGLLGLIGSGKSDSITPLRIALLLGTLGAAYGSYRGYQNKQAGWRDGSDAREEVISKIRSAPGMSFSERARLMQGVNQLSPGQAEQLSRMIGMSFGAGVAAVVAKFLMGAGLGGVLVAGVLGGIVGRTLLGGAPENALGQKSLNHHTMFNSPLF